MINIEKGWVAKNLFDYDIRDIQPTQDGGYNFAVKVYDEFFVSAGLFKSVKEYTEDFENNSSDGSWEVELNVKDGQYDFLIMPPYDYTGDLDSETIEVDVGGDVSELTDWVKDGLDYVKEWSNNEALIN